MFSKNVAFSKFGLLSPGALSLSLFRLFARWLDCWTFGSTVGSTVGFNAGSTVISTIRFTVRLTVPLTIRFACSTIGLPDLSPVRLPARLSDRPFAYLFARSPVELFVLILFSLRIAPESLFILK